MTYAFLIWCLLVCACICDTKFFKVPNGLIVLGYLLGIHMNLTKYGAVGLMHFLAGAAWPIAITYLLFVIGGLGAGDIKLFSVIGSMVGTIPEMTYLMCASVILAAVAVLARSLFKKRFVRTKLHFTYYITAAWILNQLPFKEGFVI